MSIKKHEFYEGAALHRLVRAAGSVHVTYVAPFFVLNERVSIYMKYSTGVRSPWAFTFTPEEQAALVPAVDGAATVVGLICGADGVVALPYRDYLRIASPRATSLRVSCSRRHRQHFEVIGPDGAAEGKVAPSDWQRLLSD